MPVATRLLVWSPISLSPVWPCPAAAGGAAGSVDRPRWVRLVAAVMAAALWPAPVVPGPELHLGLQEGQTGAVEICTQSSAKALASARELAAAEPAAAEPAESAGCPDAAAAVPGAAGSVLCMRQWALLLLAAAIGAVTAGWTTMVLLQSKMEVSVIAYW